MGASDRQQGPGFIRRCKNRFAVMKRDDLVVAAVNDEYRAPNFSYVITRRVSETAQPARGEPWIEVLGNVRYRRERRLHNERQWLVLCGQP